MDTIVTKKCTICRELKERNEFYKNKSRKDGYSNVCIKCHKACAKISRGKNRDTKREADKKYRQDHPEKYRAYRLKWKQNNLEKAKECALNWWRNNKERSNHNLKEWRKNHPEKYLVQIGIRRVREIGAPGSFTAKEWRGLCDKYGNKCLRCGRTDVKLTVDHVIPLSKGGTNYINNIQPLCGSCNSSKLNKTIDYR
jgi:5-methylcytosine-specific restriction endonuclease McrA